eukprot:GFUD01011725.1.p1 GENE.GFUD01011725.1~~GFUD01011725.1.p1  ORF type:complete len:1379 (+),score=532.30 GFUD01011725.1:445-4137(+)
MSVPENAKQELSITDNSLTDNLNPDDSIRVDLNSENAITDILKLAKPKDIMPINSIKEDLNLKYAIKKVLNPGDSKTEETKQKESKPENSYEEMLKPTKDTELAEQLKELFKQIKTNNQKDLKPVSKQENLTTYKLRKKDSKLADVKLADSTPEDSFREQLNQEDSFTKESKQENSKPEDSNDEICKPLKDTELAEQLMEAMAIAYVEKLWELLKKFETKKQKGSKLLESNSEYSKTIDKKTGEPMKNNIMTADSEPEDSNTKVSKPEDPMKENLNQENSCQEDSNPEESMEDDYEREDSTNDDKKVKESKLENFKKQDSIQKISVPENAKQELSITDNSLTDNLNPDDSIRVDLNSENAITDILKLAKPEDIMPINSIKEDLNLKYAIKKVLNPGDSKTEETKQKESKPENSYEEMLKPTKDTELAEQLKELFKQIETNNHKDLKPVSKQENLTTYKLRNEDSKLADVKLADSTPEDSFREQFNQEDSFTKESKQENSKPEDSNEEIQNPIKDTELANQLKGLFKKIDKNKQRYMNPEYSNKEDKELLEQLKEFFKKIERKKQTNLNPESKQDNSKSNPKDTIKSVLNPKESLTEDSKQEDSKAEYSDEEILKQTKDTELAKQLKDFFKNVETNKHKDLNPDSKHENSTSDQLRPSVKNDENEKDSIPEDSKQEYFTQDEFKQETPNEKMVKPSTDKELAEQLMEFFKKIETNKEKDLNQDSKQEYSTYEKTCQENSKPADLKPEEKMKQDIKLDDTSKEDSNPEDTIIDDLNPNKSITDISKQAESKQEYVKPEDSIKENLNPEVSIKSDPEVSVTDKSKQEDSTPEDIKEEMLKTKKDIELAKQLKEFFMKIETNKEIDKNLEYSNQEDVKLDYSKIENSNQEYPNQENSKPQNVKQEVTKVKDPKTEESDPEDSNSAYNLPTHSKAEDIQFEDSKPEYTKSADSKPEDVINIVRSSKNNAVEIKGLPWKATEEDIRQFLKDCKILKILMIRNKYNNPSGNAMVWLSGQDDLDRALHSEKKLFGKRHICVKKVIDAIKIKDEPSNCDLLMVQLSGLALTSTSQNICDFLFGCDVVGGPEGVTIEMGERGIPSGYAFVLLETTADFETALKYNKQILGDRCVNIEKMTRKDEEVQEDKFCIMLSGLEKTATAKDVSDFLSDGNVKHVEIIRSVDEKGEPSENAFIKIESEEDLKLALNLNETLIGNRQIDVFQVNLDLFQEAMNEAHA